MIRNPSTSPLRILIADDHDVVRKGLRSLLESRSGWSVCGEGSNGREVVELTRKLDPDVVILDIAMPELNGLDAARQIRQEMPRAEILVLTVHESDQLVHDILAAGARGYLLKSDAGREIVTAVETICSGKPYLTSKVAERVVGAYVARDPGESAELLTPREREITQLLAEGRSNKEVAKRLGVSVKTVETHRNHVMRKLDVHSLPDLVRYAIRNKLIDP